MGKFKMYWSEFNKTLRGDYRLKIPLPKIYTVLIDEVFPDLDKNIGWEIKGRKYAYTYISRREDQSVIDEIKNFLELLELHYYVTPHTMVLKEVGRYVDQCFALGMTYVEKNGVVSNERSEIYNLIYQTKKKPDLDALSKLNSALKEFVLNHSNYRNCDLVVPEPGNPGKQFHLAEVLGKNLAKSLDMELSELKKTRNTKKAKEMRMDEKINVSDGVYKSRLGFDGKNILLIDDTYQSGTTMYRMAEYLKMNGAKKVYGLVTSKTWRDDHNK